MKIKERLIVFATEIEANPTLQTLSAKQSLKHKEIFETSESYILISGMGCIQAAAQLGRFASLARTILNLGFACSLNNESDIGSIHQVSTCSKYLDFPKTCSEHSRSFSKGVFPMIPVQASGLHLCSVDIPLHDPILSKQLSVEYDLVDMEGYGIAQAAQLLNIPCSLIKITSDFGNQNGPQLIRKHAEMLAQCLCDYITDNVE